MSKRDLFISEMVYNGYTQEKARSIYDDMKIFIEKHSISCLEDGLHYLIQVLIK